MTERKDSFKFSFSFDKTDPRHGKAADILNSKEAQSRVAQVVEALLHYEVCTNTLDTTDVNLKDVIRSVVHQMILEGCMSTPPSTVVERPQYQPAQYQPPQYQPPQFQPQQFQPQYRTSQHLSSQFQAEKEPQVQNDEPQYTDLFPRSVPTYGGDGTDASDIESILGKEGVQSVKKSMAKWRNKTDG